MRCALSSCRGKISTLVAYRFCSVRCYKVDWARTARGYVAPKNKRCAVCSKNFIPPMFHPRAKTCCRKCSKKLEYTKHKNAYISRARLWSTNNHEKCYESQRKTRSRNPELYKAINRNKQNRRRSYFPKDGDFTASQWLRVQASQKSHCFWCGRVRVLTIDHVIPIIRGGKHTASNIVGSCKSCNSKKRDKMWPRSVGALYEGAPTDEVRTLAQSEAGLQAVWDAVTESMG